MRFAIGSARVPESRARHARSRLCDDLHAAGVAEWDTQWFQKPPPERDCGFESRLRHRAFGGGVGGWWGVVLVGFFFFFCFLVCFVVCGVCRVLRAWCAPAPGAWARFVWLGVVSSRLLASSRFFARGGWLGRRARRLSRVAAVGGSRVASLRCVLRLSWCAAAAALAVVRLARVVAVGRLARAARFLLGCGRAGEPVEALDADAPAARHRHRDGTSPGCAAAIESARDRRRHGVRARLRPRTMPRCRSWKNASSVAATIPAKRRRLLDARTQFHYIATVITRRAPPVCAGSLRRRAVSRAGSARAPRAAARGALVARALGCVEAHEAAGRGSLRRSRPPDGGGAAARACRRH